jgi:hypothetical protein
LELFELGDPSAVVLDVGARATRRIDFGPPIEGLIERSVDQGDLRGIAFAVASHVAGAYCNQVWGDIEALQGSNQAHWPHEVNFGGTIEGLVEGHSGGAVDDDVAGSEEVPAGVVEPKPFLGDVASNSEDSLGGHLDKAIFAEVLSETVEGVVLENVSLDPLLCGATPGAHDEHKLAVGDPAEEAFYEGCPQKTGRAGDGYAFALERLPDHPSVLPRQSV